MHVLVIEPNPILRRLVHAILTRARFDVATVADGRTGIAELQQGNVDLLVMAWPVADVDGSALLRRLRNHAATKYTYVVLVAKPGDPAGVIEGLEAGADDYMVKPLDLKQLRRRIILGSRIAVLEDTCAKLRAKTEQMETHDQITGTLHHEALVAAAKTVLEQAAERDTSFSLVLIDLPDLTALNRSYGYHIGSQVLRLVGTTLGQSVRGSDLVGRWTGTRFVVLLPDTPAPVAEAVATRLRQRIQALKLAIAEDASYALPVRVGVATNRPLQNMRLSALVAAAEVSLMRGELT